MIGILATCLLGLSPGVQLADTVDHRHVYLDDGRIQRVDYSSDVGLNRMNREELLNELRGLEKPSFVTPIVLLSLGGVLGISGAIAFAVSNEIGTVTLGVLAVIGGVVLIVVGSIILAIRFVQSGSYAEKLAAIQRRLDVVDQGPGGGPELPPPPPPPPPPTGASNWAPAPQFLLAVF